MIYLRVRQRVLAQAGETLRLKDVAGFLADARCKLNEMRVVLPKGAGVWQLDAPQLIMQIKEMHPEETVNVLGDGIGWLHRETTHDETKRRGRYSVSRIAVALFAISVLGALLVLLYNMGHGENRPYLTVMPYVMSTLMGVAVYFSRKRFNMIFFQRRARSGGKVDSSVLNAAQSDRRRVRKTIAKRGK